MAKGCQAKDLMKPIPICVDRSTSLMSVMESMDKKHVSFAVITEYEQIAGILSMSDIIDMLDKGEDESLTAATIGDHQRKRKLVVVSPTDKCSDVVHELSQGHIHQIVVVDRLKPVGVITQLDVDHWFLESHKKKGVRVSSHELQLGAIILGEQEETINVLLLKHKESKIWEFPKVDVSSQGEMNYVTVLQHFLGNLVKSVSIKDDLGTRDYNISNLTRQINYFLCVASDSDLDPAFDEYNQLQWVSIYQAQAELTFVPDRDVLSEAVAKYFEIYSPNHQTDIFPDSSDIG